MNRNTLIRNFADSAEWFQHFGTIIGAARHNRGDKLDTIARAVGLSKTVLSQIENGRYTSLKMNTVIVLCTYFDVTHMVFAISV